MRRFDLAPVAQHLDAAIRYATVFSYPWPHMVVNDVFPVSFYLMLLEHREETRSYLTGRVNQPERSIMKFDSMLPAFWRDVAILLSSGSLMFRVRGKFSYVPNGQVSGSLVHDLPGYELQVHTDMAPKIMTGLFYLADNDDHPEVGTTLYRSPSGYESSGDEDLPFDQFEKALTIPYKCNTALFFPVTRMSFHGVEKSPIERWVIAYDISA